jgi:hypothetical protein
MLAHTPLPAPWRASARLMLAVALLALAAAVAGCGGDDGDDEAGTPSRVKLTTYDDFHQAANNAGIPCTTYTPGHGVGLSPTSDGSYCIGEGDPDVLGDEPTTLFVLWGSQAAARAWAYDSGQGRTGQTSTNAGGRLVGDTWTVVGPRSSLVKLEAVAGGHIYDTDHPVPSSWSTYPPPPEVGTPQTPGETPPDSGSSSDSGEEGCLDDCTVTADKILADLGGIVCDTTDGQTLSDDITGRDPYRTGAQVIRVCTAGGSVDLSGRGVAHVFDSYTEMNDTALPAIRRNCPSGVTMYGKAGTSDTSSPGDGYGYLVVGIQDNPAAVQALTEGGATKLCQA